MTHKDFCFWLVGALIACQDKDFKELVLAKLKTVDSTVTLNPVFDPIFKPRPLDNTPPGWNPSQPYKFGDITCNTKAVTNYGSYDPSGNPTYFIPQFSKDNIVTSFSLTNSTKDKNGTV